MQTPRKTQSGGYMTTYTGKRISILDPDPRDVDIYDIAHHLSMICHWNGACRQFFSVAQHSVLVSLICPSELALWGLLHDAAEAYVGDMTRPLKVTMPCFKKAERRFIEAIAIRFQLELPEPPGLKVFDNMILRLEADALMPPGALHDGFGNPLDLPELGTLPGSAIISPLSPEDAEVHFLQRFQGILHDVKQLHLEKTGESVDDDDHAIELFNRNTPEEYD